VDKPNVHDNLSEGLESGVVWHYPLGVVLFHLRWSQLCMTTFGFSSTIPQQPLVYVSHMMKYLTPFCLIKKTRVDIIKTLWKKLSAFIVSLGIVWNGRYGTNSLWGQVSNSFRQTVKICMIIQAEMPRKILAVHVHRKVIYTFEKKTTNAQTQC
jgi:hypothetical protein